MLDYKNHDVDAERFLTFSSTGRAISVKLNAREAKNLLDMTIELLGERPDCLEMATGVFKKRFLETLETSKSSVVRNKMYALAATMAAVSERKEVDVPFVF